MSDPFNTTSHPKPTHLLQKKAKDLETEIISVSSLTTLNEQKWPRVQGRNCSLIIGQSERFYDLSIWKPGGYKQTFEINFCSFAIAKWPLSHSEIYVVVEIAGLGDC